MRSSSGYFAKEWGFGNEAQVIAILQSHSTAKTYPRRFKFSRSRAFASSVLGKRKYRDEVKFRLYHQGIALRERSSLCVPMRGNCGRHRRGSAAIFTIPRTEEALLQSADTPGRGGD